VKGRNESKYGRIVIGVSEFMNIVGAISLFGSVSAAVCVPLAADNRSVRHDWRTTQAVAEKRPIRKAAAAAGRLVASNVCSPMTAHLAFVAALR
jgi:hypothetical protein